MQRLVFLAPETPAETLLAAGMLAILAAKPPPQAVTVLCPEALAPLYKNAPFPCQTIPYDPQQTTDPDYPARILHLLAQGPAPDLCINARTTRDSFSDAIALNCGAAQTVGHGYPFGLPDPAKAADSARTYSRLAPHCGVVKLEVQRHRDLLKVLGMDVERVPPAVWTSPQDRAWADAIMWAHQLDPERTLVLFPEPSHPLAAWSGFSAALVPICRAANLSVIVLGQTVRDQDTPQLRHLSDAGVKVLDLRGQADFFQAAELLRTARAAIGLENVYAHIACAVGCRNAVLLAGGEFGRWFPYSPLTSGITTPLHCLGCNWKCRFERPFCAAAVAPFMVQVVLHHILSTREIPNAPQLFIQHADFGLFEPIQQGKLPITDCYLSPDALPPLLFDIYLVTAASLAVMGMPPSFFGCMLRRVSVQVQPASVAP